MHASSSSQTSVKDSEAPGPTKLVMELMKHLNARSGSETDSRPTPDAISIDLLLGINRNSDMTFLDSESRESRTGASFEISIRQPERAR
jgi:hypothetical protein